MNILSLFVTFLTWFVVFKFLFMMTSKYLIVNALLMLNCDLFSLFGYNLDDLHYSMRILCCFSQSFTFSRSLIPVHILEKSRKIVSLAYKRNSSSISNFKKLLIKNNRSRTVFWETPVFTDTELLFAFLIFMVCFFF